MEPVSEEAFEILVEEGLSYVPQPLLEMLSNVAILIDDQNAEDAELLGLYEGIPLTEREWYAGVLPDRITIYRLPLCAMCADEYELAEEVAVTVVHELAHYFGIDDHQLHEWGWD